MPANGYFVELGANDGISQSNTYWLEKERRWKGLLIEADPINAMRLANTNRQTVKIHAACGSSSYEGQIIELKHANLMTIVNSLSNKRNVIEHLLAASTVGQTIDGIDISDYMKLVTLTSLLDTVIAPRSINLLSLDVEGYEYKVLDRLDFSKYDFNYILFESRNPDRILEKLQSHGYFLFSKPTQQDFLVRHSCIDS